MFQPFGLDKALKALQDGQALTGKDGILAYTNRRRFQADLFGLLQTPKSP